MKRDLTELKKITFDLINNEENSDFNKEIFNDVTENEITLLPKQKETNNLEEVYTLANHEKNLIKKSLEKHKGKENLRLKNLAYLNAPYTEK